MLGLALWLKIQLGCALIVLPIRLGAFGKVKMAVATCVVHPGAVNILDLVRECWA